jgi:hypothetical protein
MKRVIREIVMPVTGVDPGRWPSITARWPMPERDWDRMIRVLRAMFDPETHATEQRREIRP